MKDEGEEGEPANGIRCTIFSLFSTHIRSSISWFLYLLSFHWSSSQVISRASKGKEAVPGSYSIFLSSCITQRVWKKRPGMKIRWNKWEKNEKDMASHWMTDISVSWRQQHVLFGGSRSGLCLSFSRFDSSHRPFSSWIVWWFSSDHPFHDYYSFFKRNDQLFIRSLLLAASISFWRENRAAVSLLSKKKKRDSDAAAKSAPLSEQHIRHMHMCVWCETEARNERSGSWIIHSVQKEKEEEWILKDREIQIYIFLEK